MLSAKKEAELEALRRRNLGLPHDGSVPWRVERPRRSKERLKLRKASPSPIEIERRQSGPVRLIDRRLKCERCGKPRPAGNALCMDCFGEVGSGGIRNRNGVVLQSFIPDKHLFRAVNLACWLMRKGRSSYEASVIAARKWDVDDGDIRSLISQRAGRSRKSSK